MADRTAVFTIASGASASNGITLENDGLIGFQIDTTGWTAAGVFFQGRSSSSGDWGTLKSFDFPNSQGDAFYVAAAQVASDDFFLLPAPIAGIYEIRVVSGAPGATVNQGATRTITPHFRRIY